MPLLPQDIVHKAETLMSGAWARIALAIIAALALLGAYDWRQARNFATPEAMDSAQLARNLSEGKGFTTDFVRPFSLFLIKRANQKRLDSLSPEVKADLCQVKTSHPDIANAPFYPAVLAAYMKMAPFRFEITRNQSGGFVRHQPDFLITFFNQILFGLVVLLAFFLARKLFDAFVAWISAILLFGSDLLLRFSSSGLSTMLLLVLFMGLIWALVKLEAALSDSAATLQRIYMWAAAVGLLLGLGMLTRYSFGVLLLPVAAFALIFGGARRVSVTLIITALFALVVTPWIIRNFNVSGTPFGTAGYAVMENSLFFPQHRLERALQPNLSQVQLTTLWWKFFAGLREVVSEIPKLGGGLAMAFFVVGLMFGYRSTAIARLRYFTLAAFILLIVAQALGRTALSDDSPEINSENLLVLLLPLVVIYGVSFFHTLLDQVLPRVTWLRFLAASAFCLLGLVPLLLGFLPSRTSPNAVASPIVFPPYYPPDIQKVSHWMGPGELMMSDAPWAVAWYGNRQAVWLTLDTQGEFYTLNDYIKPVRALYLTPVSLDAKFLSQWVRGGSERTWGELIVASLIKEELPRGFPLVKSYRLSEQLFFSDWERWLKPEPPSPARSAQEK